MTTTMLSQQSIVDALERAFHGTEACHCHGDGKLSRNELLSCFVRYQVLDDKFAPPTENEAKIAFERLYNNTGGEAYTLKRGLGINSLPELCALTMEQLLRCPDIGWKKAHEIELNLAREGYYLCDSDREALTQELAIEAEADAAADMPPAPKSPDETKAWAADWLIELAGKLLTDGQSLVHLARRLDHKHDRVARSLRMYAKAKRFGHASVGKLAEMIQPLDDAAAITQRVAHQAASAAAKAKRLAAPVPEQVAAPDNVVLLRRRA